MDDIQAPLWLCAPPHNSTFRPFVSSSAPACLRPACAPQVLEVSERLQLDWRRFLGVMLWYHAPQRSAPAAPDSPVPPATPQGAGGARLPMRRAGGGAAVRAYGALLAECAASRASVPLAPAVPAPLPPYAEDEELVRQAPPTAALAAALAGGRGTGERAASAGAPS
jgi:hypothetical protein